MMQMIRSNAGKFMTIIIVGGFLAWMVYGIGMEVTGASGPGDLGSVNGTPITLAAWQQRVQQLEEQARAQGGGRLTAEDTRQIEDQAWNDLVNQILMQQELDRRGIRVTDDEIRFMAMNVPAPQMAQQEIFQSNGQFDINKYRQYLSSPQASDELLAQLEQYYRSVIPESKLREQIGAGTFVPDAQLWRMFRDRNETATVEYVALDLARLAPRTPAVTEAEIRRYYDGHEDEFKRPRTARFTVAVLRTAADDADRQAVLAHAQQVRQQLAAGGDFAAIAKAESSDSVSARQGGSLGTVRKGQMVAPFDSAVWVLPVNEISQPVLTQFGYHLIQVTERGGDTAVVRHILLPVKKDDRVLETLDAKSDTLERVAQSSQGIERAARTVGAAIRQGVTVTDNLPYIPGVGPAMEALNWASGEARDLEPGAHPVSDVMEGEQGLYLVRLDSYLPAGQMTLDEARPQINSMLILQKKREQARAEGEKIVAAVRRGTPLQQAAAARGLAVQTAGPFSRVEGNPALGQATPAVGAAFGTPIGQVSSVVESPGGLFIVRPTARTAADAQQFAQQKEQIRSVLGQQLRQRATARWLDSVKKAANIKDNRAQVLGRA
ncbi:SurA N-terminal domain-containing protein [Longimicrobium sp.]|uniref:SurA N-terminal domain-containing protein n=1 Tax=Longimicrobium sp. TaxID=2029185 RepID=UPI002C338D4E|nr:SurA N-terminal domain-containing protein [Longimicrobium sp.]HSU15730.1 SurA N-terminal domain-containing protein [Longimicrobium sp.]